MSEPNKCMNNNFWDLPADERSERMREACERAGVENFWDLPPEERGKCYERLGEAENVIQSIHPPATMRTHNKPGDIIL